MALVNVLKLIFWTMFLSASTSVTAHPVFYSAGSTPDSAPASSIAEHSAQTPSNVTRTPLTLEALFSGNQRYRNAQSGEANSNAKRMHVRQAVESEEVDPVPSFMIFGCSDHRITPRKIFDTPEGSFFSHNTLASHYEVGDDSAEASLAYAAESEHVQHIIVLGHYGCKGVETAITMPEKTSKFIKDWIQPISDLYHRSRRKEIVVLRESRMPQRGKPHGITEAPSMSDPGARALVEENVRMSVEALRQNEMLTNLYRETRLNPGSVKDIFVHGFVHDEANGEVVDLGVSFGPPGEPIPHVPFGVRRRTENIHRSVGPGTNKGKKWDFKKGE